MNPIYINIVGYLAIIINLYSMFIQGEKGLRSISSIANFLFVIYGILLGAIPIIVGSSIAVFLHIYHLRRIKKQTQ